MGRGGTEDVGVWACHPSLPSAPPQPCPPPAEMWRSYRLTAREEAEAGATRSPRLALSIALSIARG